MQDIITSSSTNSLNEIEKYTTNINCINRVCCIYAYYEKDKTYKNNLKFFLENGLIPNVDYYFIINGKCTIDIKESDNIKIFKRENKGYDFGAYSYVLPLINKEYDYYFFMNTSVQGPFIRNNKTQWISFFLNLFTNENVALVGTSINIYMYNNYLNYKLGEIYNKEKPFTHIQSMFFCLKKSYLEYLNKINFFDENECNKAPNINYIIAYKEFGLSQHALINNWNINCILPKYRDINYITLKENINKSTKSGDPYFKNRYFGKTIDKYDVIFIKTNRNLKI